MALESFTAAGSRRILFATELGVGSGHLAPLCELADSLLQEGHHCRFVIPSEQGLLRIRPEWESHPQITVREFSGWQPIIRQSSPDSRTFSLADVLVAGELAQSEAVASKLSWLQTELAETQPDVVVAEFAPGITAVSRARVPVVTLGTGYSLPPDMSPLPLLAFWERELPQSTVAKEMRLLDTLNHVLLEFGLESIPNVASMLRSADNFVCTFACLDPYRKHRQEPLYLPLTLPDPSAARELQDTAKLRGFVYYSVKHPLFRSMLQALLTQTAFPLDVYSPPYEREARQTLQSISKTGRTPIHRILERPIPMGQLSSYCMCIHPGGLGVCTSSAVQNVPQLLTPISLESLLNARALYQLKAAWPLLPEQILESDFVSKLQGYLQRTAEISVRLESEFVTTEQVATTKEIILKRIREFLS